MLQVRVAKTVAGMEAPSLRDYYEHSVYTSPIFAGRAGKSHSCRVFSCSSRFEIIRKTLIDVFAGHCARSMARIWAEDVMFLLCSFLLDRVLRRNVEQITNTQNGPKAFDACPVVNSCCEASPVDQAAHVPHLPPPPRGSRVVGLNVEADPAGTANLPFAVPELGENSELPRAELLLSTTPLVRAAWERLLALPAKERPRLVVGPSLLPDRSAATLALTDDAGHESHHGETLGEAGLTA